MPGVDEIYSIARRVLLDALQSLGVHRDAVILVGAQAVYLRVGEAELAVAPYTTDGDLAINPALLTETPPLEKALARAGFYPKTTDSVGIWISLQRTTGNPRTEFAVDFLVPSSVSPGTGRRAAGLSGHDRRAARIVRGIEGALVDADFMRLAALEHEDQRAFSIRIAGPAALLVAKVHKIHDRQDTTRQTDKDALDVLRLLRGTSTEEMANRFHYLLADDLSQEVSNEATELLSELFASRQGHGIGMVKRAVGTLADPDEIATSCRVLTVDLLQSLGH